MRQFRRLIPFRQTVILLALLLSVPFLSSTSFGQSTAELNPAWSEAARGFVNKMVPTLEGVQRISLDAKNISSLREGDASAIRRLIEDDLRQSRIQIRENVSGTTDPIVEVHIIFSESVRGYVWVAEIVRPHSLANDQQIAMVEIPKRSSDDSQDHGASLNLDKKLVWEQRELFLDFAILPALPNVQPTIVILDADRAAFYRASGSGWQLWRSLPIPHQTGSRRNLSGHINTSAEAIVLSNVQCAADFQQPQSFKCTPLKPSDGDRKAVPGHEGAETAQLSENCSGQNILLTTGTGDWTQPDLIQGFEFGNPQSQPVESGDPLDMTGPVISLSASPDENVAHAIVYDLKGDHYEGYIVTATCSH